MMRILVLGSTGQVGFESLRALSPLGEVIGLDYPDVDFARPDLLAQKVCEIRPQVIYNAVAYTAVDRAESEPEKARLINATSPGVLAETASKIGAVLVHYSTDYVFDGKKGCAYQETDMPNPLSVYGQTKLEGEQAIAASSSAFLILRTAWVYSRRRDSFVTKVQQWAEKSPSIRVVVDQVSNPTWARVLSETTALLLARGGDDLLEYVKARRGIYHLAGSGSASRLDWARAILDNRPNSAPPVEVLPALTSEFPTPAERPLYSVLDCEKFSQTFALQLPPWQQALRMAMEG
jgi:dTDP-4-dehydrorhamnose reductase